MIIDLSKSDLFTKDPDERFSVQYGLPKGTWKEMYKRYRLMDYSVKEVKEYVLITTKKEIKEKGIKRWIIRTDIYSIASPVLKKGAKQVNTEIFGKLEDIVLNELTKNLRFSGTKDIEITKE